MALRRRFFWKHYQCDYDVIYEKFASDVKVKKYISICKELNKVISSDKGFNLGKSYELGHAYFMNLLSDSSVTDLKLIFKNKIIPLLAEYFYSDWDKIDLIFNRNGFINSNSVTVGSITKKIYSINDTKLDDIVNYKKIINNTNEE
jgi:5-methylcytosine-specific restriction protein B